MAIYLFYIIISGYIIILAINAYYVWKEKKPDAEFRWILKNPGHPQIYGGFLLLMVSLIPIFPFTEFPATYQDIAILLMLVISVILLILSGVIYKKTSIQE